MATLPFTGTNFRVRGGGGGSKRIPFNTDPD